MPSVVPTLQPCRLAPPRLRPDSSGFIRVPMHRPNLLVPTLRVGTRRADTITTRSVVTREKGEGLLLCVRCDAERRNEEERASHGGILSFVLPP